MVGDLGSIPRVIYERWRDVIRVYRRLHTKLYLLGNGVAIVGSANLTVGGLYGNVELNVLIKNGGELYGQLMRYFEELWLNAKPLTEDYVEDVEEVEVRSVKRSAAGFVSEVNRALLSILGVDEECLTRLTQGSARRWLPRPLIRGSVIVRTLLRAVLWLLLLRN